MNICAEIIQLVVSLAKYPATYSDQCTSGLDCHWIIVRHAHRDFPERFVADEIFLLDFVEELAQRLEFLLDLFIVVGIGGQSHDSRNGDMRQVLPFSLAEHFPAFVEGEAELRFFLGNVYL